MLGREMSLCRGEVLKVARGGGGEGVADKEAYGGATGHIVGAGRIAGEHGVTMLGWSQCLNLGAAFPPWGIAEKHPSLPS